MKPIWEDFTNKRPNSGVETIVKIEEPYSKAVKSSKLAKCPDKIGRGSAMPVLTAHVYEHTFMSSGAAISIQTSTLCMCT